MFARCICMKGLLLLFFTFLSMTSTARAQTTYSIGVLLPLSERFRSVDQGYVNNIDLAVSSINNSGLLGGISLKTIYGETNAEPAVALQRFRMLKHNHKIVAVVGPRLFSTTHIVLHEARKLRIPVLSLSEFSEVDKPKPNKWGFRIAKAYDIYSALAYNQMRSAHIRRIGVLARDDPFGEKAAEAITKLAHMFDMQIVRQERFEAGATDMSSHLLRLKQQNPEAIISWGRTEDHISIARAAKGINLTAPVYIANPVPVRHLMNESTGLWEKHLFPAEKVLVPGQLISTHPLTPLIVKYAEDFFEKFGVQPSGVGTSAYDAVYLISDAMKECLHTGDKIVADSIGSKLENIRHYKGVTGIFNFSKENHSSQGIDSLALIRIYKGDLQIVYVASGCPDGEIHCPDCVCRTDCN